MLKDIDAFCASHDIDDYDLFGEIMVGDDARYDEFSDNILFNKHKRIMKEKN